MKNRNNIPFPIGGASLIMTFFMLCLSVFGIIAYMSAQRDYNLSLKTAENVSAYYAAQNTAEEILSDTQKAFKTGTEEEITEKYSNYDVQLYSEGGKKVITYYVPIANELVLQISVSFADGETNVTCRKVKNNRVIEDEPQFLDLPVF